MRCLPVFLVHEQIFYVRLRTFKRGLKGIFGDCNGTVLDHLPKMAQFFSQESLRRGSNLGMALRIQTSEWPLVQSDRSPAERLVLPIVDFHLLRLVPKSYNGCRPVHGVEESIRQFRQTCCKTDFFCFYYGSNSGHSEFEIDDFEDLRDQWSQLLLTCSRVLADNHYWPVCNASDLLAPSKRWNELEYKKVHPEKVHRIRHLAESL